jgi:nicotinamidase-related amidase
LLLQSYAPKRRAVKRGENESRFRFRLRLSSMLASAFDLMLRNHGIGRILIGGVAAEGAVEGTARTGRDLGYEIVLLRDCVGSRDRELHDMALAFMEQTYFEVATAKEMSQFCAETT